MSAAEVSPEKDARWARDCAQRELEALKDEALRLTEQRDRILAAAEAAAARWDAANEKLVELGCA